jgi:spore coat polysaccharide biosynthesis protein SpsF (cytidylyltransferase family)
MKTIAIIPARGGSKRIPRKNIKPFLGKPIIAYSVEAEADWKLAELKYKLLRKKNKLQKKMFNFAPDINFLLNMFF